MISAEMLTSIIDGYAARFADETEAIEALRRGISDAQGEPSTRSTLPGHFTASALLLNKDSTKTLLIDHVSLGMRIQPGGHLEPEDISCAGCAQREAEEETGVSNLRRLFPQMGEVPFFIDYHQIPENPKKGEPAHIHYDLRYAFEADETIPLQHEAGAISAAEWVSIDAVSGTDGSVLASIAKFKRLQAAQ
jgi:8-oxo-dGTP pyrophosphatase MutT (NUDIX family)